MVYWLQSLELCSQLLNYSLHSQIASHMGSLRHGATTIPLCEPVSLLPRLSNPSFLLSRHLNPWQYIVLALFTSFRLSISFITIPLSSPCFITLRPFAFITVKSSAFIYVFISPRIPLNLRHLTYSTSLRDLRRIRKKLLLEF